jgi:molybdopterin-biosynthesis enzyme MoeA-like protein
VLTLMVGQPLKRIEVVADDEDEIIEAVRRMSNNYDFVVTSGGIGPTYAVPGGDIGFD